MGVDFNCNYVDSRQLPHAWVQQQTQQQADQHLLQATILQLHQQQAPAIPRSKLPDLQMSGL